MASFLDNLNKVLDSVAKGTEKALQNAKNQGGGSSTLEKARNSGVEELFRPPVIQPQRQVEDDSWLRQAALEKQPVAPKPSPVQELSEERLSYDQKRTAAADKPLPSTVDQGFAAKVMEQEKQQKAEVAASEQRKRDVALGRTPGQELKPADLEDPNETYVMTDADYNALNDWSRAGVDANTVILEALKTGNVDAELRARLKQLRLPSGKQVFDEYTSLKGLVDDKDIKDILDEDSMASTAKAVSGLTQKLDIFHETPKVGEIIKGSPLTNKRYTLVTELAAAAKELRAKLPRRALAAGFDVAAAVGRGDTVELPTGFSGEKADVQFQNLYSLLSDKGTANKDIDEFVSSIKASPAEYSQFLKYANTRSQNELNYELEVPKDSRTPEEFRKLLGFDRGEK